ncbi:hypothetical protein J6590_016855 [Homalodisca vitripennis]|nr:hypothetical protein J6590_016855 [Homalodisca vitripennis]
MDTIQILCLNGHPRKFCEKCGGEERRDEPNFDTLAVVEPEDLGYVTMKVAWYQKWPSGRASVKLELPKWIRGDLRYHGHCS